VKRTTCSSCGSGNLRQFLDLGSSPIADAYTAGPDDPYVTYPLQVAVCEWCQLVQLLEVVDHSLLFGDGYSFYTSASEPCSAYHRRYAEDVLTAYGELARRLTVEVGCNDGDLLRHFAAAGCQSIGVDPATGPARAAQERGLTVDPRPFTLERAREMREDCGPAGLVIANHVLAHVADVADMLAAIGLLLAADGVAMVEVQYLPDLLVNNAFDLVYHEHRNFFSLGALEQAARRWGMDVVDAQLTDRQGGSLRVTLAKDGRGPNSRVHVIHGWERWLVRPGTYEGMQGRAERIRTRLWDLLDAEKSAGRTVAGYGAPAKATTLLNFCGIDRRALEFVVDTTAAKQGRYIPGTGLQIVAPDDPVVGKADTFLLLAWNYLPAIVRNNLDFTATGGRWIVPIPAPLLL